MPSLAASDSAPPGISFVVNTYQHAATVQACLRGVLAQQLDGIPTEVIVVDDGSTDATVPIVHTTAENRSDLPWRVVRFQQAGGVVCRQHGIELARHELVLLLGGDFILRDPTVVRRMLDHLEPEVPFVSLYGPHGGMGTLYRRDVVRAVGGFSMAFNRFGSGFRDDSDLHYRLQDHGQTGVHLAHLHTSYEHRQPRLPGLRGAIAYAHHRVAVHQLDPLLFRRHPARFACDFHVVAGRLVNPVEDFRRATGLWRRGGRLELSSPQGVVLIPSRGLTSQLLSVLGGVAYVIAVHAARLRGSITYRTLLL
ncbi:MAG: glycosyltransferase [Egibacteraceae bacterium]